MELLLRYESDRVLATELPGSLLGGPVAIAHLLRGMGERGAGRRGMGERGAGRRRGGQGGGGWERGEGETREEGWRKEEGWRREDGVPTV